MKLGFSYDPMMSSILIPVNKLKKEETMETKPNKSHSDLISLLNQINNGAIKSRKLMLMESISKAFASDSSESIEIMVNNGIDNSFYISFIVYGIIIDIFICDLDDSKNAWTIECVDWEPKLLKLTWPIVLHRHISRRLGWKLYFEADEVVTVLKEEIAKPSFKKMLLEKYAEELHKRDIRKA